MLDVRSRYYVLNSRWRVSTCDPLQWILEQRRGRWWYGCSWCVTKEALLRCIREKCGDADITDILNFPDWHPDRCCPATEAVTLPSIPLEPVTSLPTPPMPSKLPTGADVCSAISTTTHQRSELRR